jgi:hypothetical protein
VRFGATAVAIEPTPSRNVRGMSIHRVGLLGAVAAASLIAACFNPDPIAATQTDGSSDSGGSGCSGGSGGGTTAGADDAPSDSTGSRPGTSSGVTTVDDTSMGIATDSAGSSGGSTCGDDACLGSESGGSSTRDNVDPCDMGTCEDCRRGAKLT